MFAVVGRHSGNCLGVGIRLWLYFGPSHRAQHHVLGLPTVLAESFPALVNALDWYAAGMDFADALHVALSQELCSESFATFDKGIASTAARLGLVQAITLLRKAGKRGKLG